MDTTGQSNHPQTCDCHVCEFVRWTAEAQQALLADQQDMEEERERLARATKPPRKLDTGKRPIEESPLFGQGQTGLF